MENKFLNEMKDESKDPHKDIESQSMDMKDYIAMVEELEKREVSEVLEILKKRGIID